VAEGALLEHALVFGNSYGTPRAPVDKSLAEGRDVLFDIDWQGTQQLAEKARKDLVAVFILPPSTEELERRLHTRAQDSDAEVAKRTAKAADEMSHWAEYDYIVVNTDIEASVRRVQAILEAERLRRDRQVGLHDFVASLRERS
jgi:guanylate kinase